MSLTTKQVYDLNNMNMAAQNASLGTMMGYLSDATMESGSVVPTSASREVVTTGLTTVSHVVVSLSGSPMHDHALSTATAGSVAGTIIIQSWNGLYTAGSVQFQRVDWIALGTK